MELRFRENGKWFSFSAKAIIIEDDCVLLATNKTVDWYYPIGGGAWHGETAEQAVIRECLEETGVHFEIDRLVFIHENFFKGDWDVVKGCDCQEAACYFLMKPRGTKELNSNSYITNAKGELVRESLRWVPID